MREDSIVAWQLLQRLNQTDAGLLFNPVVGRYHFIHHCRVMDPVHPRTFDVLLSEHFLKRLPSALPVYTISEKGREALRHRGSPKELCVSE